ncbi:MAG TPA: RNA polymerase factor sigma-54 [Bacteroidales bacterium]|jgi:RNA polymerase sigma-54 factor|nr:RNA polymerase factor sigma-54 [Bacteroidales bacterium]HRT13335.1 RNA polymerase factor sigma-54 [Bacteroidales bacterium]
MSRQKQQLGQELRQRLSPIMMQTMKLIETPITDLEEVIRREVDENPSLEIEFQDEHLDFDNEVEDEQDYDGEDYYEKSAYFLADNYEKTLMVDDTFQETLKRQLQALPITERDRFIAEYLLGNLDENGFIEGDNQTIANDLLLTYNIKILPDEIEKILTTIVQQLEPFGIGARNLRESWLIQLENKERNKNNVLATTIIKDYYTELKKRDFDKIKRKLSITSEELQEAIRTIAKLNRKPGYVESIWEEAASQIIPDFIITNTGNSLQLSLNNKFLPKLIINPEDEELFNQFQEKKRKEVDSSDDKFIADNVKKAKEFIEILADRDLTLIKIMSAILEYQKQYFLSGDEIEIKPMILQDIANKVKVDISTVSRATSKKYVDTPFGIIPLKHLFSEAIGDEGTSSREVKQVLQNIIQEESKKKPLSDEQLVAALKEKGYSIARRTVAKYREELSIPVARLRKEI